jgi:putative membrane protein insertion efficiency factor
MAAATPNSGWLARLSVGFVRAYQIALSPIFGGHCRFEPSCSAYAVEAFRVHGFLRGWRLALWRLLRCHPFARGGYDPVPPGRKGE